MPTPTLYREREAARAVVFNKEKQVAMLHAKVYNYHKLPGGGVEEGEDIHTALAREVLEEIGCSIENVQELGVIEEFRNKQALHQISHCFVADLLGEVGATSLEEGEIAEGFETVWMPLEEAIAAMEQELSNDYYDAKFMTPRDLTFLKKARGK